MKKKKSSQIKKPVASFKNKQGLMIEIYTRTGESKQNAIKRVTSRHGVQPDAVIKKK